MDVPGHELGVRAAGRRAGARALLAARPDRAGAIGLDRRRIGVVPDPVPLAKAAVPVTEPPGAPGRDHRHAWEPGNQRWDAFYLLVFAAVLVIVLIDTPGSAVAAGGGAGRDRPRRPLSPRRPAAPRPSA